MTSCQLGQPVGTKEHAETLLAEGAAGLSRWCALAAVLVERKRDGGRGKAARSASLSVGSELTSCVKALNETLTFCSSHLHAESHRPPTLSLPAETLGIAL